MDYTRQPSAFKLRKVARYSRLYGPGRTMMKIRGQYHLKKRYTRLPASSSDRVSTATVGLIGCGNFAFTTIAYYLKHTYGNALRGAMDIDISRAASIYEAFDIDYYTGNAADILDDSRIRLVYIASNHASHAEYAIEALKRHKYVHIEKPHVVNQDQLERLTDAMAEHPGRVSLGFNRPNSPLGREVARRLDSEHGTAMLNWFVAGHELPEGHWYYDKEEGGRVLGNLCHWTDFIYQLVDPADRYPIRIVPARASQSDCDIAVSYIFGNGTIGTITFSAKGHTFEGVRERLSAHRGNTQLLMEDFHTLVIETGPRKERKALRFRDHGHRQKVCDSFEMAHTVGGERNACSPAYVWETGQMFLGTRTALEEDREVVLSGYRMG